MIPTPLLPFLVYKYKDFAIGGEPEMVQKRADQFKEFGEYSLDAAAKIKTMHDIGFLGDEGERYSELLGANFPTNLEITGHAHIGTANAIQYYHDALVDSLAKMSNLTMVASGHHQAVQQAFYAWQTAQKNALAAQATAFNVSLVSTPLLATPAAPGAIAAMAKADAAAAMAEEALVIALNNYRAAREIWEADLKKAAGIKDHLTAETHTAAARVDEQARKRFRDNADYHREQWNKIVAKAKEIATDKVKALEFVSEALLLIGAVLLFFPGGQLFGGIATVVGLLLKTGLVATGNSSWQSLAFDVVTSIPGAKILKLGKAGKLGAAGARLAKGIETSLASVKATAIAIPSKTAELARGALRKLGLDPVDMSTGVLIDYETDVSIDGILPLIIDRNSNSGHAIGRALGPQWVSRIDCRIEICTNEILMLAPDGALLTFPPAPLDGSEVRADGRPWLLSFVDGAYRVRDIAAGLTYVFSITAEQSLVRPTTPIADEVANYDGAADEFGRSVAESSLAGVIGSGIEVGLSSVLHRTGHWIEYDYDASSGLMSTIRRSDGTIVRLGWDRRTARLADVYLTHVDHHTEEPVRLVSYEYDAHGRLRRVVNSADGSLGYHYDDGGRICGWTDRNGVTYKYQFDEHGRVVAQAGTGGVLANAAVWLDDTGSDAPEGGKVCVAIETAVALAGDPRLMGDEVIDQRIKQLQALPLVQALTSGGLVGAGLTGSGRTGVRDDDQWTVPHEWLHDEVLGDIRPTVYRSTAAGDVWRVIAPDGACEDYSHNQYHAIVEVIAADGGVSRIDYDDNGCITKRVFADGGTEHVQPGPWGVPAQVTGRDGAVTEYEVDAAGLVTAMTGPGGRRLEFAYQWRPGGVVPLASASEQYGAVITECDDAGRVIATTDAEDRRTSVVRDAAGRVVESMDATGAVTRVDYSPEGWPWRMTYPDGSCSYATYDGEGNVIATTDQAGAVTTTTYTVFDTPQVVTNPAGQTTSVVYNSQLQPVEVVNADGRHWWFDYDLCGRMTSQRDYNGHITRYETNRRAGWSSSIDAAGQRTTIWRDVVGNIVRQDSPAGVTSWLYDTAGRLVQVTSPDAVVDYAYTDAGEVIGETITLPSGERFGAGTLQDEDAGVLAIALPTGQVVRQEVRLDSAGQGGMDIRFGEQLVGQVGLHHDVLSRTLCWTMGAITRTQQWDERGRVTGDVVTTMTPAAGVCAKSPGVPVVESMAAGTAGGVVAGRWWSWEATDQVSVIEDVLRGTVVLDTDAMGRVTGVSRRPAMPDVRGVDAVQGAQSVGGVGVEVYGFSAAGMVEAITAPDFTPSPAGLAKSARAAHQAQAGLEHPQLEKVHTQGTLVTRVGKTSYRYDRLGRVVETVTRRTSVGSVVKRFGYVGSTGQVSWFSSSDTPEVVWRYSYDGLGRRVAKTCVDVATGGVVSRWVFVYSGSQLVAEYVVTPAADTSVDVQTAADACVAGRCGINAAVAAGGHPENNHRSVGGDKAPVVGRVWVTDPVSGVMVGQLNLHETTGGVVAGDAYAAGGGVCGWSQRQVDAVFYALVADLAGAPQELIDLDDGSVAGWVTQSLYGRRCWRGVDSPLLFIGQYEDQESGWVYNRFRFYDPWSGVYGSQDPLGVAPNPATPYGYVGNPVLWVDPDALKACSGVLSDAMLTMMRHVDDIAVNDKTLRNIFNVAGMVDADGNIYFASGAMHNLDPSRYPGLNIVSLGSPAEWKGLEWYERLPFHAEQKLLDYAKANNIDVAAIYTYIDACPNRWWDQEQLDGLVKGMYKGFETCDLSLRNSGLKPLFNTNLYLSEEALELLKGDQGLKAKLSELIAYKQKKVGLT